MTARLSRTVSRLDGIAFMGIWFAILLHCVWATMLILSRSSRGVTGVHVLAQLFPNRIGLAIVLLVVAGCATTAVFLPRITPAKIMLLLPQQLVLGLSAAGAARAMYLSHYADGVVRPASFLIADQAPQVIALLVHSATIVYLAVLARRLHAERS